MSFDALLWATNDAPIRNVNEFAVMVVLAEKADPDGCNAFPSRLTMASRTHIDQKTVLRTLKELKARGLICEGDQNVAAYIRADKRPRVYDLMIPYSWFPNIERTNRERAERGRQPLTSELRPDISEAPPKARRSDLGKKRPRKDSDERGDFESPRDGEGNETDGGTLSPGRGDSESFTGGLRDTQPSPCIPSSNPVPDAPSARSAPDARRASTGSSAREAASGSAASGNNKLARLTRQQKDLADDLYALLPEEARRQVPRGARGLSQALLRALAPGEPWERTPQQVIQFRVMPRWDQYYAGYFYAGTLTKGPIPALHGMLKRSPLCNDARCDEHRNVDDGEPCISCEGKRQNDRGALDAARRGGEGRDAGVPTPVVGVPQQRIGGVECTSCLQDCVPVLHWRGGQFCGPCLTDCESCHQPRPDRALSLDSLCPDCVPADQFA